MTAIKMIAVGMEMKVGGGRDCKASIHSVWTECEWLSGGKANIWFCGFKPGCLRELWSHQLRKSGGGLGLDRQIMNY